MDSNKNVQFMQNTETSNTILVPMSSMMASPSYIPSMGVQMSPPVIVNQTSSPQKFSQAENLSPTSDELIMKIRKPYTITKQRERWTEEEHVKFLEALKLYGRQWRRIEEHIGTKTAVQIRSHAQKFFCKIEKDANSAGGSGQSALDIDIPPPRPKRKPSHPYPRKAGSSSNGGSVTDKEDDSLNGESSYRIQGSSCVVPSPASAFISAFRSQMGTIPMFPSHPHPSMNFPSSSASSALERSMKNGKVVPMVKLFGKIVAPTPQRLNSSASAPEGSIVEDESQAPENQTPSKSKSATQTLKEEDEKGNSREVALQDRNSQFSKNSSVSQDKSNQSAVASGVPTDSKNKEKQESSTIPPGFPPWMAYPPGMMGFYHPKMQDVPPSDAKQSKAFFNPESWHTRPGMWPMPVTGEQNALHPPHMNPHLHPPHSLSPHPFPSPTSMPFSPYLHPGFAMGGYPILAYGSQFEAFAQNSNGSTTPGVHRSSFSPWRSPIPMWNGARLPGNVPTLGQNGQVSPGSAEDNEAAAMAAVTMAAAASTWWNFPGSYPPPFFPGYTPNPAMGSNSLTPSNQNIKNSATSNEAAVSEKKGSEGLKEIADRPNETKEKSNSMESDSQPEDDGEDEDVEEEREDEEVQQEHSTKQNKDVQSTNSPSIPTNSKTHLNPSSNRGSVLQRKSEKSAKSKELKNRNRSTSNHASNSFPNTHYKNGTNNIDDELNSEGDPSMNPTAFKDYKREIDATDDSASPFQEKALHDTKGQLNTQDPSSKYVDNGYVNEELNGFSPRKRQRTLPGDVDPAVSLRLEEEKKEEVEGKGADDVDGNAFECRRSPASDDDDDDDDDRMDTNRMDVQNGSSEDLQNACMGVPSSNSSACGDIREIQRSVSTDGTSSDGDGATTQPKAEDNAKEKENRKGTGEKEEKNDAVFFISASGKKIGPKERGGKDSNAKERVGEGKEELALPKFLDSSDKKGRADSFSHEKSIKASFQSSSSSNHLLNPRGKSDLKEGEIEGKRQRNQENSEPRRETSNEGRIAFHKLFTRESLPRSFSPPPKERMVEDRDDGVSVLDQSESGVTKAASRNHETQSEARLPRQASETSNNRLSSFFSSHLNGFTNGNSYYTKEKRSSISKSQRSKASEAGILRGDVEDASSIRDEDENNVSEHFGKISIRSSSKGEKGTVSNKDEKETQINVEGLNHVSLMAKDKSPPCTIEAELVADKDTLGKKIARSPKTYPSEAEGLINCDDAENENESKDDVYVDSRRSHGFVPYHQSQLFQSLNRQSNALVNQVVRARSESNLPDFPDSSFPPKKQCISKASSF